MPPRDLEALKLESGLPDQAKAVCRQILAEHPECAESLDLLGVHLRNRGELAAAVAVHRVACLREGGVSQFHNNLGVALTDVGLLEEAVLAFERALELAGDDAQVLGNLGVALMRLGRLNEAKEVLARAVALQPESFQFRYNLGSALHLAGETDAAIAAYEKTIALEPNCGEAWCNLGVALRAKGDLRGALAAYERAGGLMPRSADVQMNLGVALDAVGRRDDAIAAYERAIELNPNASKAHYNVAKAQYELAKTHYNLANTRYDNAEWQGAIEAYQQAIELRPDFVGAHSNLGNALLRVGRRDEAMAAYERAIELDPKAADPHWNRALALLQRGDYAQGWEEYEWRNRLNPPSSRMFPQPLWRGEDLAGRTILLHAEHGLGDTVQFARYAPLVKERGGRVVLGCQPELRELLKGLEGVDQLVVNGETIPAFDVQCPLMSLPLAFGTRVDSIPNEAYLKADESRVEEWRARVGVRDGVRRVGLSWAGRPLHQYDRQRSMALAELGRLGGVAGVRLFSLQKGAAAEQAKHPPDGMQLIDHTAMLHDYADTAALISQLDLVISVDTSVAHVAAAMGKPVWLLLAFAPDWRWMLERADSPWYPSMQLFRQGVRDDWRPVIEEVVRELSA